MKKGFFILSLFLTSLFFLPSGQLHAQTSNPWNGPRWSSVKVTEVVWQWVENNGYMPDEEGEWVDTDWYYEGQAVWKVVIEWGDETGQLGTHTLYIKNNGTIVKEE